MAWIDRGHLLAAILLAAVVLSASPAGADAIDGEWCHADGRHMSILGPAIVTPGGTAMQGRYDRHGFAYVVPENETNAGAEVIMALMNENTIHLWLGDRARPRDGDGVEVWHRCQDKTS